MPTLPPRDPRRIVSITAQMCRGGEWQPVTIANVAEGGLLAKATPPPAVGEEIEIRHRGVTIAGTVVRSSGRRFAVAAHEPIELDRLLAKSGIAAPSADLGSAPSRPWWHWRKR